jgi:hypothetical protein
VISADQVNNDTPARIGLIRTRLPSRRSFSSLFGSLFFARSPRLDEFDSVNFPMGVRAFNLWDHQPHPPGYPFFIFLDDSSKKFSEAIRRLRCILYRASMARL